MALDLVEIRAHMKAHELRCDCRLNDTVEELIVEVAHQREEIGHYAKRCICNLQTPPLHCCGFVARELMRSANGA